MAEPQAAVPADIAWWRSLTRLFTEDFTSFLRRRGALKHFSRPHLPAALARAGDQAGAAAADAVLLRAAGETPAAALARLVTSSTGLSRAEAARRLARDGPNEIAHEAPLSNAKRWWLCYRNPFNFLLTALAILGWLSGDARATVVVGGMVLLSTGLRFVQEGRSHRAVDNLRHLVANTATVRRPVAGAIGEGEVETAVRELVEGDVVVLSAGDMVPADCRVLTARDLFVAQSSMTGESAPVEKSAVCVAAPASPLDASDLLFMGTSVVSGSATALVLATGARSWLGMMAARATAVAAGPTAFEAGVNSVSWLLIRFGAVMVPIVFFINGVTKGNWLDALLFAVSVAVGLTPEMLPMIVTSTLARGAVQLARQKVVVKRLDAIQNFGAMEVLCTDKTGTLTQDKVAVVRATDPAGRPSAEVLNMAFLNSFYQTGLKNLLDHAILERVAVAAQLQLEQRYRKVDELPFDFVRRRMSVLVAKDEDHHLLICKGAVEEVLDVCTLVRAASVADDVTVDVAADVVAEVTAGVTAEVSADLPLDATARARIEAHAGALAADGLRLIAVAVKRLPVTPHALTVADESALTLLGFVAFVDPPKESAAPALRALAAHGIRVVVLSGDNALVTAHLCALVDLPAGDVLLGTQVAAMDDAALRAAVMRHDIYAKLAPLDKERIVQALRAGGCVVGFMGDGINDAAALRAADIGISFDSAVDIARESADIILLEKSLLVLDQGVIEGRNTFCNMLKYIRMTASSNFGNVLSVVLASALLPFLPMLPIQLLVQNLLYDLSQAAIPFDRVDADLVARPLRWQPRAIGRFMLCFGPVSSVFDLVTFALLWWGFAADSVARQGLFQTGWFLVGLSTQTLIVHLIRTPALPFAQSRPAPSLLAMSLAIAVTGLWLPWSPLAPALRLQPMPSSYFGALAAILAAYLVGVTLMKRFYIRRFGWQ